MFLPDKLENLLLTHWTEFLDSNKLLVFVLQTVRDTSMPKIPSKVEKKGIQIKLSKCHLEGSGLVIWVDFRVPKDDGTAVGTIELSVGETIVLRKILGTILN